LIRFDIYSTVMSEGKLSKAIFSINRSDYLLHAPPGSSAPPCIKQVEFNSISASFMSLSQQVCALHRQYSPPLPPPPLQLSSPPFTSVIAKS
jgi:hypothetical protein